MVDINKWKKSVNIALDVHNEYKPDNNPVDNRLLNDMQETIKNTSKLCFGKCVNLQSSNFSKSEARCIQECTIGIIEGLEHLIQKHEKIQEDKV